MLDQTHISDSVKATEQVADHVATLLATGGLVALEGDLGAGKTQFVRGLVRSLGGDPRMVHSPTYILLHTYPLPEGRQLYHLDAYRVRSAEDFEAIGFDELLAAVDEGDIIAIEWPTRVRELIPPAAIWVTLEHTGIDTRRITVRKPA